MKEGDVLITVLAQSDGTVKNRPVLCIRQMPLFNDFLVCGLSTQLRHEVPQFDEVITPSDVDFRTSGIEVGFIDPPELFGRFAGYRIQRSHRQHFAGPTPVRLRQKLADYLRPT